MSAKPCRLLLFVRYPQAGQTKTRLIPAIGAIAAANLQQEIAEYLLEQLKPASNSDNWQLQIYFTGCTLAKMRKWLGNDLLYRQQSSGDLGARLWNGFKLGFEEGCDRIVAIGADCPSISRSHIQQSFDALLTTELVLGPAQDGGYYLIGLNRQQVCASQKPTESLALRGRSLFQSIDWSTSQVLQQTQSKAKQMNLSIAYLETLSDIDRPQDMVIWNKLKSDRAQV